ncbi:unnamed protein product [Ambrosiozyma monospora]|uniref:Unnamed protein product n=1 Tax=Ambrosiozyma monospora TaxID=43982 RepID=A0ACB5T5P9_AMBMO|nr:unnamed protein product [Ambrosiozyma monospora]
MSASSKNASMFGFDTSKEKNSTVSALFGKPTAINNKKLISNKVRSVVQIPADEKDQDKMDVDTTELKETHKKKKRSDEDDDLEDRYINRLLDDNKDNDDKTPSNEKSDDNDEEDNSDDEDDQEEEEKSEETEGKKKSKKAKVLDLKQEELEKAERTIFVGNLPAEVIASKKSVKHFKRHLKAQIPDAEIQSIRFRSVNLNSTLPKKLAYISKSYNEGKNDIVNSYVVFKTKSASLAATKLNGTTYLNNHLRVDHMTHPLPQNNKLCIFVGNLDFEEREESLWTYFNKKLEEENCVTNVRIIRDSKTNFGKGFAIVQFSDTNFVERALLLNDQKLEGSNKPRKLRISRCKAQTGGNNFRGSQKNLSDKQKTIIGRGKKVLSKSDRTTIGRMVIEGERAKKDGNIKGIKVGGSVGKLKKKPRSAGGRASKRRQAHKLKLMQNSK